MTPQTDSISEELRQDLTALQGSRVNTLSASRDLQIAMRSLLQHEARRIEQKLGRQHPRSQRLSVRLKTTLDLINTLEVERQLTQVKVPQVADDAALVHGRVVDENRRGIAGLVVCLVDAGTTPIGEVEGATTDTTGYYAIMIDKALIDNVGRKHTMGVFLAIFTARGRFVHRERKPLALTAGVRSLVNVSFNRDELTRGVVQPCKPGPSCEPPTLVSVPDLIGRPEQEALAVLQQTSLKVGNRQARPTPDQVGLVLTQEPKAGTEVEPGTAVSLVIGVAEQVTVPEIVGLTLDEAGRKLQDSGLAVGEVSQRPDEQVGIVLAQDPTDGEQVVRDTAVNLVVGHRRPDPGETVMGRIEGHPRFAQLGVSARQLTEHFGRLGIGSVEQAAELLTHPNPELRDSLGLSSLRQVQIFKRLLREIIETPN